MVGDVVDQEWFDRREEKASGVADPRHRPPLDSDGAAQFLKNEFAAGRLIAAQQTAFKLRDKHGASLRLERPEIVA